MTLPHGFLHTFFEFLGYFIAGRIYFYLSKKRAPFNSEKDEFTKIVLLAGAVFGAFAGSVLAHMIENYSFYKQLFLNKNLAIPGKSVLGGLLGGIWGTEIAKKIIGYKISTGDIWVIPIFVGIAIGRIGCQLIGLEDTTYGKPTLSNWGWDYGDGILRYPVALIESICVLIIGFFVIRIKTNKEGLKFNLFILSYCIFRFIIEYFKPPFGVVSKSERYQPDLFLNTISGLQIVALFGIIWMSVRILRSLRNGKK